MADGADGADGAPAAGTGPAARAAAWLDRAEQHEREGRRDRALVAARTAMALLDRAGADLDLVRAEVARLSGPDVVPMHVDVAAGDQAGPQSRAESRAVWLGAPAEPVLAMLGWVVQDDALEVVRVVVPGTRRGRAAFAALVAALPELVDVTVRLPARDPAVRRVCERAGFAVVPGSAGPAGHVGGSVALHRAGATG